MQEKLEKKFLVQHAQIYFLRINHMGMIVATKTSNTSAFSFYKSQLHVI